MNLKELQKAIEDTPPEVWERLAKEMEERQQALDDECAKGNHQGTLSNPIFSGADIWWECSRCKRREVQIGGNRPMTI